MRQVNAFVAFVIAIVVIGNIASDPVGSAKLIGGVLAGLAGLAGVITLGLLCLYPFVLIFRRKPRLSSDPERYDDHGTLV
jgi:hypothetical protein